MRGHACSSYFESIGLSSDKQAGRNGNGLEKEFTAEALDPLQHIVGKLGTKCLQAGITVMFKMRGQYLLRQGRRIDQSIISNSIIFFLSKAHIYT